VCMCFAVVGTNLAPEGKASQYQGNVWYNASKAIDGKSRRIFSTDTCTQTGYMVKNSWWMVDFNKLIAVNALEIMPGKCYIHTCIYGYVSYVNLIKYIDSGVTAVSSICYVAIGVMNMYNTLLLIIIR